MPPAPPALTRAFICDNFYATDSEQHFVVLALKNAKDAFKLHG